jgi:hypothetical protein
MISFFRVIVFMKHKHIILRISIFLFLFNMIQIQTVAQSENKLGVYFEFQAYPTGLIPGLRIEKDINEKSSIHLRLGYNFIRHGSKGVHEDERGDGYGFTLGYKRHFNEGHKGLFLGLRNDIWFNSLEWQDNIDNVDFVMGQTDVTVVQPTLEAGYSFVSSNGWVVSPSIAFGFEINAKTDGSEVGEGAILLLGVQLGKRF